MEQITTCYRHSGRQTGLSCASCGRPICPECSIDTPAGQKCPECAKPAAPQVSMRQWLARPTPVTYTIMGAAIAVYVAQRILPGGDWLFEYGAQANWLVDRGEYWRLITAAFLHSNQITHILFNMYALYLFGPELERRIGGLAFGSLYFAAAMGGGVAAFVLGDFRDVVVGASGAIFGILGAWLYSSWRTRHTRAGNAMFRQMLVLLAINAALPLFIPRISWQGHTGGLVAGMAVVALWGQLPEGWRNPKGRSAVALAVAALLFVLVLL